METLVEKLRKEIEELENQIESHPFGSLFDKKRTDQLYQKLKKRRKELAKIEGSGSPESTSKAATPPVVRKEAPKTKKKPTTAKAKSSTRGKTKTTAAAKSNSKASASGTKKPATRKVSSAAKGKSKSNRSTATGKKPAASKKTK